MQIGKAFYCDGCGVNIYSGTHCNECDPLHGLTYVVDDSASRPTEVKASEVQA
jgi:hypothetical protein